MEDSKQLIEELANIVQKLEHRRDLEITVSNLQKRIEQWDKQFQNYIDTTCDILNHFREEIDTLKEKVD